MNSLHEYVVAGFSFSNEKEAENAREEEKKVYYIRRRLNFDDVRSVLVIYNKMVTERVFKTPIGMGFLAEVYDKLLNSGEILKEELEPIPLLMATSLGQIENVEMPRRRVKVNTPKNYRKEYNFCRFIIAVLVAVIVAMFIITANADNPNILNYETAIKNKYSAWASELKEKESELRAREKKLLEQGN